MPARRKPLVVPRVTKVVTHLQGQDPTALVVVAVDNAKDELRRDIEAGENLLSDKIDCVESSLDNKIVASSHSLQQQVVDLEKLVGADLNNIRQTVASLTSGQATTALALKTSQENALAETKQATKDQVASVQTLTINGDQALKMSVDLLRSDTEIKFADVKKELPGGDRANALLNQSRGDKRSDSTLVALIVFGAGGMITAIVAIIISLMGHPALSLPDLIQALRSAQFQPQSPSYYPPSPPTYYQPVSPYQPQPPPPPPQSPPQSQYYAPPSQVTVQPK